MKRAALLIAATIAALVGVSQCVKGTAASFTAAVSVNENDFKVDAVDKHFAAAPGASVRADTNAPIATGTVDTMRLDFGTVPQPTTYDATVSVSNPTSVAQPATVILEGAQQIDSCVFASTGTTTATIPAGGSDQIVIKTSAAIAGHGTGEIRLAVSGSESWEYEAWPVVLDQAPAAPSALTAAAARGGTINLSWAASPTENLTGYDIYRSTGAGAPTLVNQTPLAGTSFTDQTPTDAAYSYQVRAAIATPALTSLPTATASATSDRVPPALTNLSYVDGKRKPDQVAGSSEPGATITVSDGTNTWTTTVPASGTFTQTVSEIDGNPGSKATPVSFTITAADAAGNTTTQALSATDTQ